MRLTKRMILLLVASGALSACARPDGPPGDTSEMLAATYPCSVTPQAGDVLVIGDSISIGYTPHVAAQEPQTRVVHNPCNAMTSDYTRDHVTAWLEAGTGQWQAITFNNGLWDINEWCRVPLERYRANLILIARAIKAHTAHPYFVLTTQVLPGTQGRSNADVLAYNDTARAVMQEEGIPIIDLYSISANQPQEHVNPTNVHYTDAGYATLAQEIVNTLGIL